MNQNSNTKKRKDYARKKARQRGENIKTMRAIAEAYETLGVPHRSGGYLLNGYGHLIAKAPENSKDKSLIWSRSDSMMATKLDRALRYWWHSLNAQQLRKLEAGLVLKIRYLIDERN